MRMVMTRVCRELNKDDLTNVGRYGMNLSEKPVDEQRETIRAMIRDI